MDDLGAAIAKGRATTAAAVIETNERMIELVLQENMKAERATVVGDRLAYQNYCIYIATSKADVCAMALPVRSYCVDRGVIKVGPRIRKNRRQASLLALNGASRFHLQGKKSRVCAVVLMGAVELLQSEAQQRSTRISYSLLVVGLT